MKKINIVKKSTDFTRIIKSKTPFKNKYFIIYKENTNENIYHFGISVSKKIGNAVVRNKLKRRVKDIIDKSALQFLNKDYIIVLKKSAKDAEYLELKEEIIKLFN